MASTMKAAIVNKPGDLKIEEVNNFVKRFEEEETEQDKRYLCQEMAKAIRNCERSLEEKEDYEDT